MIDRIFELTDVLGISMYEFTKKTNVSKSYYHKQRKNNGNIGSQVLWKIAEAYPSLNLKWLTNGDLPIFLDENSALKMQAKNASQNASQNASLNKENDATIENFPADGTPECPNCKIIETKYFEARDYLHAKETEVKELNQEIGALKHENTQLRAENAELRAELEECKGILPKTGTEG